MEYLSHFSRDEASPLSPNSRMQRSGLSFTVTDSTQPRHLQKKWKVQFSMRTKGNSSLVERKAPTAAQQKVLGMISRPPRACFLRLMLNMLPSPEGVQAPMGGGLRAPMVRSWSYSEHAQVPPSLLSPPCTLRRWHSGPSDPCTSDQQFPELPAPPGEPELRPHPLQVQRV